MFYEAEYMISVEIESTVPLQDMRDALQKACDEGAEFQFRILTTKAPSFVVLFWRDASEDDEYIAARMSTDGEVAREAAAFRQLAAELEEPGIELLGDLVSKLNVGEAKLIQFGALDDIKPSAAVKFLAPPRVCESVSNLPNGHTGGLYMDVIRPLGSSLDSIMVELHGIAIDHGFDPKGESLVGDWQPHGSDAITNAVWFFTRFAR